jgi:alanine racemase
MKEQRNFYRDTWAEIDLDAITENIHSIRNWILEDAQIIAVVKANAYGHGAYQVAQAALNAGSTYLAVAFLDEALSLREKGIEAPILVLGASRSSDVEVAARYQITLTVFRYDWLIEAQKYLNQNQILKLHLKIDTGMGRIGIRNQEEVKVIESLVSKDLRFSLEGV